jgi:hypothetical protein
LVKLEAANIFGRCRIRRSFQEAGKAVDEADIVTLRFLSPAMHGHVLEHALAQRADWRASR